MIMFFPHNAFYRKKALRVDSLVWPQGGASVIPIPGQHYLLARTKYKALVLG